MFEYPTSERFSKHELVVELERHGLITSNVAIIRRFDFWRTGKTRSLISKNAQHNPAPYRDLTQTAKTFRLLVMVSVALICSANRCRSIMAHAIFTDEARKRSLNIDIYSAGILDFSDQPPLDETSRTCLHFNTPPPKLTPTWVRQLPIDSIDRFLVMEQHHADALQNQFGISADRVALLGSFDPKRRGDEIPDPYFSYSEEVYLSSYCLIRDCIIEYLDKK
jgi:protein-tyrosine-phosphatase